MADRETEFHALYRDLRIVHQKRFYKARGEEYQAAHRQVIVVRNVLLVAAALAGVAGQLTSGTARVAVTLAAAALAASAGVVTAFGALIGFPRLSKLYSDAEINLAAAEIDWDSLDPHGDVTGCLDRVEEIFRKENGQWGQLVVEAGATIENDSDR
jgi:hypothetical protein